MNSPATRTGKSGGTRSSWPTSRRSRRAGSPTGTSSWRRTPTSGTDLEAFLAGHDEVARLTAPLRAARAGRRPRPGRPASRCGPMALPPGIGELGDFRLLREVGRGGMGVVYEAEQISLRRRVALKVLPFAAAIDPRRLQRFKTEALTAAHVQHEKIVPVHAVGCERGVHYYAMQFIEGQSLAALIGELRRLRDERNRACRPRRERPSRAPRPRFRTCRSFARGAGGRRGHARRDDHLSRTVVGPPPVFRPGGRAGPAGGAGAGARPPGGDRASRRQAGQPAAGPPVVGGHSWSLL